MGPSLQTPNTKQMEGAVVAWAKTKDGWAKVVHHTWASPSEVWAVLSDGWLYGSWVVGTSRIRGVDPGWPEVGARVHHSVGVWPLLLDDETTVLHVDNGHRLVLAPKGWPAGEARVEVTLERDEQRRPHGTIITIIEDAVSGPGAMIPQALRQRAIAARNVEALRRLAFVAEGQSRP